MISKIVNCDQIFTRKLSNNFIILKVNEIGKIRLLGNNIQKPSQIIINGIDVGPNTYSYNFTRTNNIIKIYWSEPLTNCSTMFYKCFNITEIDLSNFVSSKVVDLSEMFYQCNSLNSINFGNFDTSSVTNMNGMFLGLLVITTLDMSSFNTSKVVDMSNLFSYLRKIEYINIDNFDTSSVTSIQRMFLDCFCLKSINLLNFKSNSLTDISYLFHNCESLTSVDLSTFNTSKITLLNSMFNNCKNLEKININHFSTSLVTDTRWLFNGCIKLTSIDISNFDLSNVFIAKYMFSNCDNLEIIKFTNLTTLSQINETTGMFQNCKKIISLDLSFINASKVVEMSNMFYNCEKLRFIYMPYFKTNLVKNMASIFSGCQSLEVLNIYSFVYNINLNLTDIFKDLPNNLIYCIYDNSQLKDINSILQEKNMTNNCSYSCSYLNKKMIEENRLCIDDCTEDINNNYEFNNKCYNDCPNGTKSSTNNKFFCVEIKEDISNTVNLNTGYFTEKINIISNIVTGSIFENVETNLITYIQECSSFDFFNKKCKISNDNNMNLTKNIIEQIKNDIKNGNLKSLLINVTKDQKEDLILEESNIVYQITTSDNQNKIKYKSISTIKLGKCEDKLKDYYNIASNESLLIFKIDIYEEGLLMPIVEYEIYNQENFTELDLNICKNITISGTYSMNKDIPVDLINGVESFSSSTTDTNQKKIRIFKLPSMGISEFDTSTFYTISSISSITFNFPKGGEYTFSFYLIDEKYKTISSVCKGTITIYSCYASCETCSGAPYLPSHRCETCLTSSKYYPLIERRYDSIKNCYDYTTILTLTPGYYLYNGYWYECYIKCKKCITLGDDNEQKGT